jgi:hypothetical protein
MCVNRISMVEGLAAMMWQAWRRGRKDTSPWKEITKDSVYGRGVRAIAEMMLPIIQTHEDAGKCWKASYDKARNECAVATIRFEELQKKYARLDELDGEALGKLVAAHMENKQLQSVLAETQHFLHLAQMDLDNEKAAAGELSLSLDVERLKVRQLIDILDRWTDPV